MRALVIDDSRAMRRILAGILTQLGHESLEAANGQEGFEKVQSAGPFDFVLVDWNMPILNGYEFVRKVRAVPDYAAMKIIMVTTEVETSQVTRALEAGANEYVMKPFTADIIRDKLEMLQTA